MREIKFRGKRVRPEGVQDAWAFGSLIQRIEATEIHDSIFTWNVHPETIGQFTGLIDKNGTDIYEGDIIQDNNGIGVLIWFQTSWGVASYAYGYDGLKSYTAVDSFYVNEAKEWEVIGNIHDNPELIK